MNKITDEEIQLFKDGYTQIVEIKMNGLHEALTLTEKDILQGGLIVDRYSASGNALELGSACSAELTLSLTNNDGKFNNVVFEGAELFVRIGIKKWNADRWENAQLHYVPLGYFTVDETPRKLASINLVALDRMVRFDKLYDTGLVFPATIDKILKDACKNCNVPLAVPQGILLNYDYEVKERPTSDNLTYRQIIAWIGEITGTCAYIDCDGRLSMKWYTPTNQVIDPSVRYTSDVQENEIAITGVQFTDSDENKTVYLSGTEGYVMAIEGNALLQSNHQEIVNAIGNKLNGFTYLPYSATVKSCPYLSPLDRVTFVDKDGVAHPSAITNQTFKINANTNLSAVGESTVKKGYASANPYTASQLTMIANIQKDLNKKMSDMLQATTELNDVIANSLGLYRTSIVQPDGSVKTYSHDKPKLEDSGTIYTMTEGGFAFTTKGWNNGNPTWQYGVSKDGNAVLNALVANTLTALHITGSEIEGTTFKGGRIEALEGNSYFDLNNGKFYCNNVELSGKFEVNPTSNTSLKLRHGAEAVRFINGLWSLDGMEGGWGSVLQLEESTSASLDYKKDGRMCGTICFAESNRPDGEALGPLLLFGCAGTIFEFGLSGNSKSITSLTAPNANGEITTYIDGAERSKYTDKGMTINNEITTDDVTFNSVEEIKTNITEATDGALDIVKKAKVYNYDLKRDKAPKKRTKTKGNRYGFVIGREVPEELLAESKESISLYNTVALLTKAVQEQAETIEMQSNRIDELTDALKKLQEKSTP